MHQFSRSPPSRHYRCLLSRIIPCLTSLPTNLRGQLRLHLGRLGSSPMLATFLSAKVALPKASLPPLPLSQLCVLPLRNWGHALSEQTRSLPVARTETNLICSYPDCRTRTLPNRARSEASLLLIFKKKDPLTPFGPNKELTGPKVGPTSSFPYP